MQVRFTFGHASFHTYKVYTTTIRYFPTTTSKGAKVRVQGAQLRTSISTSQIGMQQHHHHRPTQYQHRCWWSARCSKYCNLCNGRQLKFLPCPPLCANCNNCCIVHSTDLAYIYTLTKRGKQLSLHLIVANVN